MEPNFLIIGAPKCGTSSLHAYLSQHPDIFMPEIKEPHYFGSDLSPSYYSNKKSKYLDLFKSNKEYKCRGEASTWYLYSKKAPREIIEFNPDMKLIVMLRNPIEASISLHSQALFSMNEDEENFMRALELERTRINGEGIPANNKRKESLFYTDAFQFSKQLERYLRVFDPKNLHIILFDDFVNDLSLTMHKLCKFLGITKNFEFIADVQNQRKKPRNKIIHKIIQKRDKKITRLIPQSLRYGLHNYLKKLNSIEVSKETISDEDKYILYSKFESDIHRLEELIDRPLNQWKLQE